MIKKNLVTTALTADFLSHITDGRRLDSILLWTTTEVQFILQINFLLV